MKKIIHILRGWGKAVGLISSSDAENKLSDLRVQICEACPMSKESKALELIGDMFMEANNLVCTKCGCPCKQKSLITDEQCPLKKW